MSLETWQVTEWDDPIAIILTQWGKLPYNQYLGCEINRWYDKDFRLAWVEIKKTTCKEGNKGDVAMFTAYKDQKAVTKE